MSKKPKDLPDLEWNDENPKVEFQSQLLTTGFFAMNSKQACETPSNTLRTYQPK